VGGQLALDRLPVGDRIGPVQRGEIEDVDKQARALDVREEVVAQAGALAGALDEPRDVGQHELAVIGVERAEHGLQSRERVVGNLRRRARQARQQRRLARVGQPDEPDVGQQLEAQVDPALVPGQPALGEVRRLARGGGEALVAAPARTAAGEHDASAGHDEVVGRAVRVDGLRARRDAHDQVAALGPVAQRALPMAAAARLVMGLALERLQVAHRVVAEQHDVAAAAAVAAVGAAARHVGLAAE
jgi:hypothetical protein